MTVFAHVLFDRSERIQQSGRFRRNGQSALEDGMSGHKAACALLAPSGQQRQFHIVCRTVAPIRSVATPGVQARWE